MYVCMYVCTHVRTYVCVYVCMYVCTMQLKLWYTFVQLSKAGVSKLAKHCLCLEVLDITKCFNVDDQAIQDVLQVRTNICMYVCVCMYVFVYVCTYVCMYVCMYIQYSSNAT